MQYGTGINWTEHNTKHQQMLQDAIKKQTEREIIDAIYYPVVEASTPQQDAINASASAGAGSAGGGNPEQTSYRNTILNIVKLEGISTWQMFTFDVESVSASSYFDTEVPINGKINNIIPIQNRGFLVEFYDDSNLSSNYCHLYVSADGTLLKRFNILNEWNFNTHNT